MNRIPLGVLLGIVLGLADVSLTLRHPPAPATALLQAFSSRFALGFFAATVNLPVHPVLTGILTGLLVSLPDAFGLHSYAGILGSGAVFGALAGLAVKLWAK